MSTAQAEQSSEIPAPNPSSPFAVIRSRMHTLPDGERKVAEFALRHTEDLLGLTVTDLAQRLDVSDATVIRFCQRLGYAGYKEFRILVARNLKGEGPDIYAELSIDDDAATVLQKTTRLSMQSLQDTLSTLDAAELERASRALLRGRTVGLFGVGGSGGIAVVAQQRLLRVGVSAFACTDAHTIRLICRRLGRRDVGIGIAHSGNTGEIVNALEVMRSLGAVTIALTNRAESLLTSVADIVLLTGAAETPLASEAGASRIVQLAAIDALCACIILRRHRLPEGGSTNDEP